VGNDLSGPSANQGRKSNPIPISTMIGGIGRIGHHGLKVTHEGTRLFRTGSSWSSRILQFIPNGRAYDDVLQTLNLLGVLGVLAVHLMGPAIAG
jgi:hypothetical protein